MEDSTVLPDIPDHVIEKMLPFLHTKAAICMSCVSKQWRSFPISDFDEGDDQDHDNIHEHERFINMLKFQLKISEGEKQRQTTWDKFRLRMTRYSSKDAAIVCKWLNFSFNRGVKEMDLMLRGTRAKDYYYLSRTTLLNAQCLTSLKLEHVRIKNIKKNKRKKPRSEGHLLPCVKTMSLKAIHFDPDAMEFLVEECPNIEYLTLMSCYFERGDICIVSESLKVLELTRCQAYQVLLHTDNLESVTIISAPESSLDNVVLGKCFKLKHMNICDETMNNLHVQGGHDVKGTINAPKLYRFLFEGYLSSKFSFEAPNLRSAYIELFDKCDGELTTFNRYQCKLIDFLEALGRCTDMVLYVHDLSDLIFPEENRESCLSPVLPNLKCLRLEMKHGLKEMEDLEDLNESLCWMAPSLEELI